MKKVFLFLFITSLFSFTIHKYYVALTEIEYDSSSKSVQIIMNVFMDDIEMALNKEYNINAEISNTNEIDYINNYFEEYLQEHFKISVNNELQEYLFIGKEYEDNMVYFYLEIENISGVKSIEIQNTILTKYFPEQQNLVKAKINNVRKSLFLSKENDKGLLNY